MTTIQIKKQLNSYLPLLSMQQQELLLDMVKNILLIDEREKKISVAEYNVEIEESLKQINEGNYKTQKEVIEMIKKWQRKK